MSAVAVLFWLSLVLLAYIYAGYPLLVWLLGRVRPFALKREPYTGRMSVVIAGYNEGGRLARKLDSLFASDCQLQIEEVLIGSDGSDDNTAQVIASYGDPRAFAFPRSFRLITEPFRDSWVVNVQIDTRSHP